MTVCGCPYKESPILLGSLLGLLIVGNSHKGPRYTYTVLEEKRSTKEQCLSGTRAEQHRISCVFLEGLPGPRKYTK